MRYISYSEIQSVLTCEGQHDFRYGDRLAGCSLKPRETATILSNGRAWGAAVAAWHAFCGDGTLMGAYDQGRASFAAHGALSASYRDDVAEQAEMGVVIYPDQQVKQQTFLGALLDDYTSNVERFHNLTRLEGELNCPIPGRRGFRFHGFIDGYTVDEHGHEWLVEFKLRGALTPIEHLELSRQLRFYAWALQQKHGRRVVGAIADERLAELPKPAKRLKNGKPSHDKRQLTTPESYVALCEECGEEPHPELVEHFAQRKFHQRQPILFTQSELQEAGEELASATVLIRDLDSGRRYPIRNAQKRLCSSCEFLRICANPCDDALVDSLYVRDVPKRDRLRVAA